MRILAASVLNISLACIETTPRTETSPLQGIYIFTWKCASRHNGVHFFETRHLSLQKWSEHGVFCAFSLPTVLRATTACTFSTSQRTKVVRTWCVLCFVHFDLEMCFAPQRRALFRHRNVQKWSEPGVFCVLYILTWKCASRHNGVQFFISHLAGWLRTRRFSESTFWRNHWKKHSELRPFSRICIFFLLIFSLLTLLTSAFQLSILSEVSLLNFLR